MKKTVVVCETQPLTAEGLRSVLAASADFECVRASGSLPATLELARRLAAGVLMLDKAFGLRAVLEGIEQLHSSAPQTAVVVWGVSITEPEALLCVRAGARGILRKSADPEMLLACLRAVTAGATWMEQYAAHDRLRSRRASRTDLTARERQVLELVGQGLKNREIATQLGIRPGTVKVHLKHIFEKTGAQGRYNLALAGLVSAPYRPSPVSGGNLRAP